jgi:hypothetical protein
MRFYNQTKINLFKINLFKHIIDNQSGILFQSGIHSINTRSK